MEQLDPLEAEERLGDGAVLLDVREQVEWDAGHAPDAVHLPLSELQARVAELDAATEYVVVCKAGGRSQQACQWLEPQGHTVHNLAGGMLAWQADGRDVITDDGDDGYVLTR